MVIKHLVFSGGGPAGLLTYGAAKCLNEKGLWSLENIKSIYGCSIGSYMGVILSLGYEWEWLDDYFIKRPWEKVVSVGALSFIEAYEHKGLLGEKFVVESLKPLLNAKDLNENITLRELYEFNKIEIHIYATNLNAPLLEKVDISYKTHPTMSVIKALTMSTAYPFAFKPICENGGCYVDGGLLNNYPLNDCLEQQQCDENEVLAFRNNWLLDDYKVTEQSSLIDFLIVLLKKMHAHIDSEPHQKEIKNTITTNVHDLDGLGSWLKALSTEEMRKTLIEKGYDDADIFFNQGTPGSCLGTLCCEPPQLI
jgi:predicted acylesterase/phospholipase RssA